MNGAKHPHILSEQFSHFNFSLKFTAHHPYENCKNYFYIIIYIIYNNIRFFITFYYPCTSGENKTEIEIEMAGAVFPPNCEGDFFNREGDF